MRGLVLVAGALLLTACSDSPTMPSVATVVQAATVATAEPAPAAEPTPAAAPTTKTCADVTGAIRIVGQDKAYGRIVRSGDGPYAHELIQLFSTLDGQPYDRIEDWGGATWYLDTPYNGGFWDETYIDSPTHGQWVVTLTCGGRQLARITN